MECKQPCCFENHPRFLQEITEFIEKHCNSATTTEETVENIERLLTTHFYRKVLTFTGKHLGIAQGFSGFTVYWMHMVVPNSNLSRTQLPKAYFYKQDGHICFLCLDSHIQNYKDSKLRAVALNRLSEVIEVLKANHV